MLKRKVYEDLLKEKGSQWKGFVYYRARQIEKQY